MKENFYFRCCVSFILPLDVILFKLWCRKKERERRNGKKNMKERSALRLKTIIEYTYQNECSRWQFGIHRTLAPVKRVVFGEYHVRVMKNAQRIRIRIARGCTHFSLGKRGEKQNKKRTSGIWISFMIRTPKFSKTIPSEAAKNANTCEMKCFSSAVSFSQCFMSSCKSTSSVEIGERKREFQGKKKKVNF